MNELAEPSVQTKPKRGRPAKPKTVAPPISETPEQKRIRLMAELAELNQQEPQKSGPVGPNYWTMNHSSLKALLISKSIIERTGSKESMIGALQAEDLKSGLQPHARENENLQTGLRAGNSRVSIVENTRDSVRIIDEEGNQYAIVNRVGRMVSGNPVILDMRKNAELIVAALNDGRDNS